MAEHPEDADAAPDEVIGDNLNVADVEYIREQLTADAGPGIFN